MTAPSLSSVTFADLLRHHRLAAGLTQEELATRSGLSSDAISTLERGARRRPRNETVALLAEALVLPAEERAAFVAAARRSSASALAATPPSNTVAGLDDQNGHDSASTPDATLPQGVVTFLFADIEGSAHLLHQLGGDRYAEVLNDVQALLRTVWAAHGGYELGTQGDRFFAVFAYADDALAAAVATQQALAAHSWPDGAAVRLCTGLHTGPALLTAGRYVGLEVHRAVRIAAAGHGGQVVVSHAVAEQVAKFGYELPVGTSLQSLGTHRLQDLPHREQLYQLVVPGLPGVPASYPPLRTLDAWRGLRADLTAVVCISVVLLAVVGLLLPLVVPVFPRAIGLGVAGLAGLMLASWALVQPVRRALHSQWRDARKPVAAVSSALLSLVVVSSTLFITKPAVVLGPQHAGYDFSYTYHVPTHRGGTVTVEFGGALQGLTPYGSMGTSQIFLGLWQSCLTQLPNTALGLAAYKPDQCTEVPTVANRGEDPDAKWTIFHIDPRAVWSDGEPITAADYRFADQLAQDPNIGGGGPPFSQHTLSVPDPTDPRTVRIDWTAPSGFGDYLAVLIRLQPVPLHVYATGKFAGVYDPATGAYNSALAQQFVASSSYLTQIPPVDDGPFTVQSFVPNSHAVLVRNPRFFSNFFHHPSALDGVTLVTVNPQGVQPHGLSVSQIDSALIADYRRGGVDLVDGLGSLDQSQLRDMPKAEVVTTPNLVWLEIGFNQRAEAPNAQANGGVSLFRDKNVRKAFVEAFDRCTAVRAQLGTVNCSDPNFFTDEATTLPAPDYDPSAKLPGYNPADAAHLMDQAGYRVVDGIRRAKDGTTPLHLTIGTSFGGANAPLLAHQLQQDYMRNLKVGVTLDLSGDLFGSGEATNGTVDIGLYAETGAPDPVFNAWDTFLDVTDAADIPSAQNPGGYNWLGIVDPAVVQQVQLGSRTPDAAQSANVYRELQRYVAQQYYVEPMFILADVVLVKPTLCNFKPFPQFTGDLWSMPDWYVAPSCP